MTRTAPAPTRYEIIAYRPTGAVLRAVVADFPEIETTIRDLRREIRDTAGWSPEIRVWRHAPDSTRDITGWYPRA